MVPAAEARSCAAAERARFRAWVRAHHPDVGGDPDVFATGLARRETRGTGAADVVVVRRRRWPIALLYRWRVRRLRARYLR